jgi:histone-lysine N-methyltransferase SETD2
MARSPPPLFDHLPDATADACKIFQVINDCLYGSRNMGSSDHDALDCDCAEEWRKLPFSTPRSLSDWVTG